MDLIKLAIFVIPLVILWYFFGMTSIGLVILLMGILYFLYRLKRDFDGDDSDDFNH